MVSAGMPSLDCNVQLHASCDDVFFSYVLIEQARTLVFYILFLLDVFFLFKIFCRCFLLFSFAVLFSIFRLTVFNVRLCMVLSFFFTLPRETIFSRFIFSFH